MSARRTPSLLALASALCFLFASTASAQVVISQVYGGGGSSSGPPTYTRDYIELFNRGGTAQSINGWSVQYASATGTSWSVISLPNVSIPAGRYYLIVTGSTGSGGTIPVTADLTSTTINAGNSAGKMALVSSTGPLSGTGCPLGASIVDYVGYGSTANCSEGGSPTPNVSTTTAAVRNLNGCTDTNNNAADFTIVSNPVPRNSASPVNSCGPVPTNPTGVGASNPSVVPADGTTPVLFTVTVTPGANPASTGLAVSANLSAIGRANPQTFYDNGTNGDATAGDNIFSYQTTVAVGTATGTKTMPFTITDLELRTGTGNLTLLVGSALTIPQIQGTTGTSPYLGQAVSTSGIVTYRKSNGFVIQSETPDTNPLTSEGLFVFTSSAPADWVVPGAKASVLGSVVEFRPNSTPNAQTITEIGSIPSVPGTPTVTQIPGNYPLPAPIILTSADFNPSGTSVPPADVIDPNAAFKQPLERYEFMRVQIDTLNVVSGSEGFKDPEFANGGTNGRFYGVLPGTNRPFREAGVDFFVNLPATPPPPCCVPRFDGNLEKFRIDTIDFPTRYTVANNTVVTGVVGVLDFLYTPTNSYLVVPTEGPTSPAENFGSYVAVPASEGDEFTVASMNVERFFNDVNDGIGEPVPTAVQFQTRLTKLSLQLRNAVRLPDIIGFQEIENIATLRAIRDRVNADAGTQYEAYLFEGNDVGGIDVGFLVKTNRVQVTSVTQENKAETWTNPTGGTETLNDRPPVVLKANILGPAGPYPVTVVVVHQRSLNETELDNATGRRARAKRQAQAESLAKLLSNLQTGSPVPRVICVGDFNAFEVNDGYTDVMGTSAGNPVSASEVVVNVRNDFLTPDFVELLDLVPASERYSYVYDGHSQNLDHIIVNGAARSIATRLEHARVNAGFPEVLRSDATRPERVADHDPTVAYFKLPGVAITASAAACAYSTQTASVADPGGPATYHWAIANGFILGPNNDRVVTFTGIGPLPVTLWVSVNRNGFSSEAQTTVPITPGPIQPFITAPASLCAGATNLSASVDAQTGATYAWNVTGGTLVAGGSTNAILFNAGSGPSVTLGVTVTLNGCARTESKTIPVGSIPSAPGIVNPLSGTTNFTSGYLSWTNTGALEYDVYYDTVTPPQKKVATTSSNFISTPAWFPGTTYYWSVTARTGCGSASSSVASFTTGACPFTGAAPALAAPANGSLGLSRVLVLSWSAVPGAGRYDVYLGPSASPSSLYKISSTPLTSQQVSLNPGTLYFWRVVAVPACGSSAAASSVTYSFTTADSPLKLSSLSPSYVNRWTGGNLSLFGSGFGPGTTPFTSYKGQSAGSLSITSSQSSRIDGFLSPNSLAPAGRYDAGILENGVEQARLLQALAVRAFTDVTENDFYFESSARVVDAGIMEPDFDGGTAGPQFSPSATILRRDMADYLARAYQWWRTGSTALPAATCVPSGAGSTDFPDVPCSDPDWLAIHWIKTWGVTLGSPCAQGLCFLPENGVDRAQMVTFFERLRQGALLNTLLSTVGETDPGCAQPYPACSGWTDPVLKTAGWPRREVNVAFADRLTVGCSGTPGNNLTMCATSLVTRGEMAEFLGRTIGLVSTP
ncbi:MAG: lamin tail domain-containing protein [Thermoanaerobaculia bacterium]|nr:lamin tail domain-containing protein [Thermoanaerobaculia bacterium]